VNLKLSIIIVNYKGRDYLDACLLSIYGNPPREPFEVIVVDNASNDGSVEFVQGNFPDAKVIANKYNYGFATANNQGFQISRGEYLMALNPDAEIVGDSLNRIIEILDLKKEIGIISPCILENSVVVVVYDKYPIIPSPRTLRRLIIGGANSYSEVPTTLKEVSWIWGTGYLCRRSALGDTFFDESTFLFAEEQEICTRVREHGYSITVCPEFLIKHIGSVTYGKNKEKSALARKLLESACWRHRKRRLGTFLANTHQFLRGVDDLMMWIALRVKDSISKSNEGREFEMSNLKANVTASIYLIVQGESYFEKINREARIYFNDGVDIPFPPETL
jgi:GT2 family glycosyltransferase